MNKKKRGKRGKKIKKKPTQYTTHHINPRSRCNGNYPGLTVELPKQFHDALHIVFGNLRPEEMIIFLKEITKEMKQREVISGVDIILLRDRIKS